MKVVLISQQGSGTNLLRAFLNSHPDIYFADELFVSRTDKTGAFQKSDKKLEVFLNDFYSKHDKIVGFDLKYNQMTNDIIKYLKNNNISVLHLLRDKGRTFLKNFYYVGQMLTYNDLIDHCNYVKEKENFVFNKFRKAHYLEITYEEMTQGRQVSSLSNEFENKLFEFLQIEPKHLFLDDAGLSDKYKIRFY